MSKYKTVEARVWEHEIDRGDTYVAIAFPGRMTQVSYTAGYGADGITVVDVNEAEKSVAEIRKSLTKLKGMNAAQGYVPAAIEMIESTLEALEYAFPGCTNQTEG